MLGALPKGDWNGLTVLHTAASRVGALDFGFVPGAGGLDAQQMAKAGAHDVVFLVGADEISASSRGAFVVYIGSHGDARRPPRRRRPAGRGLYRESRDLCQHRRPRPAWPTAPPSRRARPARTGRFSAPFRRRWANPCPSTAEPSCAPGSMRRAPGFGHIDAIPGPTPAELASLPGGELGAAPSAPPIADFYLTNPIAPRLARPWPNARRSPSRGAPRKRRNEETSMIGPPALHSPDRRLKSLVLLVVVPGAASPIIILRRPQSLGGGAAAARTQRRRPVRPAAELRRHVQVPVQGNDHPDGANKGVFLIAPMVTFDPGACRLGGDPVR